MRGWCSILCHTDETTRGRLDRTYVRKFWEMRGVTIPRGGALFAAETFSQRKEEGERVSGIPQ